MSEQMEFPETFEKFAKEYGFKDDKEVYTNGSELIPVFRVKQWLEHIKQEPILDKIREEIEQMDFDFGDFYDHTDTIIQMVLEVIDKCKVESEDKE